MARGLGRGPLGTMPLGGAVYDVAPLAAQPAADVFRRISIKRRQDDDGLFEPTWQDISYLVKTWGTVERSIDDVKLNRFRNSGFNFTVRNDTGKFNLESNPNSLWFGYLTRYKTLVKVEGGYLTSDDHEAPTDPTLGIFLMDQELPQRGNSNDLPVACSSLQVIFDGVRAEQIGGLSGVTLTASEIVAKIRDHTDGAGSFVFRQYITSTAWTIETTTTNYLMTDEDLRKTTWDVMQGLAEAERKVLLITRTGGIDFRSRDARTTTAAFAFAGQGFPRPTMIRLDDYKEALDKFYTYFSFKFLEPDTTTSYVSAGTTTVVSPTNTPWKYSYRPYDVPENSFVQNTATAQALVDGLLADFGTVMPKEATWTAKFVPDLEVLDRVTASYHSYEMAGLTLWDTFRWDEATWTGNDGENFDWDDKAFKVLSLRTNLDNFTVAVKAGEI